MPEISRNASIAAVRPLGDLVPVPMAATMAEAIPVPEAGTSSIAPAAEPSPPVKAQPVVVAEAVVVPPPLQVPVARPVATPVPAMQPVAAAQRVVMMPVLAGSGMGNGEWHHDIYDCRNHVGCKKPLTCVISHACCFPCLLPDLLEQAGVAPPGGYFMTCMSVAGVWDWLVSFIPFVGFALAAPAFFRSKALFDSRRAIIDRYGITTEPDFWDTCCLIYSGFPLIPWLCIVPCSSCQMTHELMVNEGLEYTDACACWTAKRVTPIATAAVSA